MVKQISAQSSNASSPKECQDDSISKEKEENPQIAVNHVHGAAGSVSQSSDSATFSMPSVGTAQIDEATDRLQTPSPVIVAVSHHRAMINAPTGVSGSTNSSLPEFSQTETALSMPTVNTIQIDEAVDAGHSMDDSVLRHSLDDSMLTRISHDSHHSTLLQVPGARRPFAMSSDIDSRDLSQILNAISDQLPYGKRESMTASMSGTIHIVKDIEEYDEDEHHE